METSDHPTYERWVQQIFAHPVTDSPWYWDLEADISELPPALSAAYLAQLFAQPDILQPYSEAQLNQGFWYLVSNGNSNYMFSLIETAVPWPQRHRAIQAIPTLFRQLFSERCTPHLSHLDEPGAGALNSICYMWWDVFPAIGAPQQPQHHHRDLALLDVMAQILQLDAIACQESALHGLGHWQMYYPQLVQETIDRFLAQPRSWRPELRAYAVSARQGCVQ